MNRVRINGHLLVGTLLVDATTDATTGATRPAEKALGCIVRGCEEEAVDTWYCQGHLDALAGFTGFCGRQGCPARVERGDKYCSHGCAAMAERARVTRLGLQAKARYGFEE